MIVPRGHGPVGDWWFTGREDAEPSGRDQLRGLLRQIEITAQILESAGLLTPEAMSFRGWLTGSYETGTLVRAEGEDLELPLATGASGLAERGLAAVERERPGLYPVEVVVSGRGVVLDGSGGEHAVDDVAWLSAHTLDHHVVTVFVQSDDFLRWGVDGTEHRDVWERNAPRLEEALAMIGRVLGTEPWGDSTPHAHVDGLRLVNRTDADGDVLPTFEGGS